MIFYHIFISENDLKERDTHLEWTKLYLYSHLIEFYFSLVEFRGDYMIISLNPCYLWVLDWYHITINFSIPIYMFSNCEINQCIKKQGKLWCHFLEKFEFQAQFSMNKLVSCYWCFSVSHFTVWILMYLSCSRANKNIHLEAFDLKINCLSYL